MQILCVKITLFIGISGAEFLGDPSFSHIIAVSFKDKATHRGLFYKGEGGRDDLVVI